MFKIYNFNLILFYVEKKQTIASLDNSCYTGAPKKADQLFAAAPSLLSVNDSVKKDIVSPYWINM